MREKVTVASDDDRRARLLTDISEHPTPETLERGVYFKELFRLQGMLVRLQELIVHKKLEVVVIFEGRDAAGKGGAIKRITQRLTARSASTPTAAFKLRHYPAPEPLAPVRTMC